MVNRRLQLSITLNGVGFFSQKGPIWWFNTQVHEKMIFIGKVTSSDKLVAEGKKP